MRSDTSLARPIQTKDMKDNRKIKPIYIFLFFLSFYLLTFCVGGHESYFYSVDGKVEYNQMKEIIKGDFSLLISPHKYLGLSLAQIPFYLLGEAIGRVSHLKLNPTFTLLINPVVTALTCMLLFLIISVLSKEITAIITTMLYGFATLAWPYSKFDTADPLLTLCVVAVFWALLKLNRTGQMKWFIISLVLMAATYITKPIGYGFILGWLLYVYLTAKKADVPAKRIAFRIFLIIMIACLFLLLNINVIRAHHYYGLRSGSWFKDIFYKSLVKGFSPLDGLFWFCPLLLILVFSVRKFARRFKNEFIFILALTAPYFLTLLFFPLIVSLYDFGGRFDIVYIPLLLIMMIPFIERFSAYSRIVKNIFIVLVGLSLYVQWLGSSVSILYYSNLVIPSLGGNWHSYAFSLRYSPFGIYPLLIIRAILGVEIPVEGINNTSASIIGPFQLDFFWTMFKNKIYTLAGLALFLLFIGLGYIIFKRSGLIKAVRKYIREGAVFTSIFCIIWILLFIPKSIILKTRSVSVKINNPGLETTAQAFNTGLPEGWGLIDYSSINGQPSIVLSSESSDIAQGKYSLRLRLLQDDVLVSLCSQAFDVKQGEIVQASCLLKTKDVLPYSVRICFLRDDNPIYYSATTDIRAMPNGWNKLTSRVLVPRNATKASFMINIWGYSLPEGASMLVDYVRIIKKL